jgi:tripartite-type tricarboxylate transporter receptor subunit TctC
MRFIVLLAGFLATLAMSPAGAQQAPYPGKPVRIVVPYASGGGADLLARSIGQKLGIMWNQSVIIENRPGAAGSVGTEYVARTPADGYTLLMASPGHAINPSLYKKLPFDPEKDFSSIGLAASGPLVLVVSGSSPMKSVSDFLAEAKARPGSINYASAGIGSSPHLAGELLKIMAGVDLVHIAYKGTAPALTDLIGGQVQAMLAPVPTVIEFVKAGKLKALGVTSLKPFGALPGVEPVANAVPGYDVLQWWGLVAPRGVPAGILAKINADVDKVLHEPDMARQLVEMGADAGGGPAAEFDALIHDEIVKWGKVIRSSNIQAE